MKVFVHILLGIVILGLVGCKTTGSRGGYAKKANTWDRKRGISDSDLPAPDWWYARRDYNSNFMHWGKMRHPDAAAKSEKWVLLNEDQCKAPHRRLARVSADNGREYRFYGFFLEDRGYEPASDQLCPIFVLQKWELLSSPKGQAPAAVDSDEAANNPPPPPKPEADEQASPPKPIPATGATNATAKPKVAAAKPKANPPATNAVIKAKPAAPKPVAKKKIPAPSAQ
jgi:hypothetical protein